MSPHSACHCDAAGSRSHAAAWMEMVSLSAMATFLAFSYLSGRLAAFVAPGYVWLTPAAAVVLYAMLIASFIAYVRRADHSAACHGSTEEGHSHHHDHHGWHVPLSGCMVVLLVPIVLAIWINPQRLSADGARKRRLPVPPRNVKLEKAFAWVLGREAAEASTDDRPNLLPAAPTVVDLLSAVEEGRGHELEGRFVTVIGQCDSGRSSGERFDLYRLVVTCCIADATSVSVEVAPPAGTSLDAGGWVRVGGIIKFDSPLDPSVPVIHAATVSRIPEPSKPYL